jgi:uncharacterized protein (TIGR02266 family)
MPNARLNDRAPFFAEVDVLAAGTPSPRRVWGTDVSETGMFIQTTHPFRVGDRVSLRFDCATTPVHVRAAEVMWVRPFEPISVDGSMPGVGVKFVALDPPTRAALRRFVAPHLVDTTLPETPAQSLESLPPPVASLPPITGSIVMKTTGRERADTREIITDEMIAVSLPPFTEPPFKNTKPMGTPAPITIGPRRLKSTPPVSKSVPPAHESMPPPSLPPKATMSMVPTHSLPPHPLAGWTFRKEDAPFFENDTAIAAATDPPQDVSGPPQEIEPQAMQKMGLGMRFDDDGPASSTSSSTSGVFASMSSFTGSLPPDEARLFEMSAPPAETSDSSVAPHTSTPPITQVPDEDAVVAVEAAVIQGDLAIKHLPIGRERRSSPMASVKSRALPMAFVLLCAGTLVGVVAGTVVKRMKAHVPVALATPAMIEAPTLAPPAPVVEAPPAVALAADVEEALAAAPKPAGPIVSAPPPVKDANLPRKAEAETTLASTAPVKTAAKAKSDKQIIEVSVGDAKLVKAFTLASPSRVVVDVSGGKLPKAPMLNPGDGVSRIRFGTPAPGTGRVVVELDREGKAEGVETWVSRGVLTVTFK